MILSCLSFQHISQTFGQLLNCVVLLISFVFQFHIVLLSVMVSVDVYYSTSFVMHTYNCRCHWVIFLI